MEQYVLRTANKNKDIKVLIFDNYKQANQTLMQLIAKPEIIMVEMEQRIRNSNGLILESTSKYYYN